MTLAAAEPRRMGSRVAADFFDRVHAGWASAAASTGGATKRCCEIAGLLVRFQFAGPALPPVIAPAFAHLEISEGGAEPHLTVRLWDCASSGIAMPRSPCPMEAFTARGELLGFDDGRYHAAYQPLGRVLSLFDRHARLAVVCAADASAIPAVERAAPLRALLGWLMRHHRRQLVHAAALGTPTIGLLLVGRGGAGKSNTALGCLLAGLCHASDDFCAVSCEPQPVVHSLYCTAKVAAGDWAQPSWAPANPDDPEHEKRLYYLEPRFRHRLPARLPLSAMVWPSKTGTGDAALHRIAATAPLLETACQTSMMLPNAGAEVLLNFCRALPARFPAIGSISAPSRKKSRRCCPGSSRRSRVPAPGRCPMIGAVPRVLHVIERLSLGGAARALIAAAKYSRRLGFYRHDAVSLLPPDRRARDLAAAADVTVATAAGIPDLHEALAQADIVQFHFWNSPGLHALLASRLPAMRALVLIEINGNHPPHVITDELVDFADMVLVLTAGTLGQPRLRRAPPGRVALVHNGADFTRLDGMRAKPHPTFNVGYIGTLDFAKMHPDYVAMSAAVRIPSARFIVCGDGCAARILKQQVRAFGADDRFEFRGYVEDIREVIEQLDVFGYPLCEDNYSASELILQEVMFAGVPPVVLPFGGAADLVGHGESGLVARDAADYACAIEYLHANPDQRARIGASAAARARACFSPEDSAAAFNAVYDRLLRQPKRERRPPLPDPGAAPPYGQGASAFVRSLGDAAGDFITSLTTPDEMAAMAAETRIAVAAPALGNTILEYRNHYPDDGHLRAWSGLVLADRGRPALAAAEFKAAIARGHDGWRIFWYLARAAGTAGSSAVSADALRVVREAAPEFAAAWRPGWQSSEGRPVSGSGERWGSP